MKNSGAVLRIPKLAWLADETYVCEKGAIQPPVERLRLLVIVPPPIAVSGVAMAIEIVEAVVCLTASYLALTF